MIIRGKAHAGFATPASMGAAAAAAGGGLLTNEYFGE